MKGIDLLNKIVNEKEAPEDINYDYKGTFEKELFTSRRNKVDKLKELKDNKMIKDKKDKVINLLLERIATLEYEVEELQKENDLNCNLNKSLLKDIDKAGKEIERLNNVINKALHKLRASKDHFKTERENNTIVFVIRILESDK